MESWQTARHLAKLGKSQRFISLTLGISREAVARAIKQEEYSPYKRGPAVKQRLDSFSSIVEDGVGRGLNGKRLLASIRKAGYDGSSSTFYRWLAQFRKDAASAGTSCRYETGPAEQAQFDWSPYTVQIGGAEKQIVVYSVVLCYSRRIHFYASLSERLDSVIEGLEAGLRHFGGSCRFVVTDNAKSMVLHHGRQQLVWNKCFLGFCGHYRIQPIAATPRHPQTKGKVENPFQHLEAGLLTGSAFRDWDHLCEELDAYEREREQRVHHTTRQRPAERFEDEREGLTPLPLRPFLGCLGHVRQLNNDGLFSFEGTRYCVPAGRGVHDVRVRTRQGRELIVYNAAGEELIRHIIVGSGSPPVIKKECYEHLNARRRLSLATQTQMLRQRFPTSTIIEEFIECLLRRHTHHPENVLSSVLQLLEAVPDTVALLALSEAVRLQLPDNQTIALLLARPGGAAATQASATQSSAKPNVPVPMNQPVPAVDVERPLSDYAAFLPEGDE